MAVRVCDQRAGGSSSHTIGGRTVEFDVGAAVMP